MHGFNRSLHGDAPKHRRGENGCAKLLRLLSQTCLRELRPTVEYTVSRVRTCGAFRVVVGYVIKCSDQFEGTPSVDIACWATISANDTHESQWRLSVRQRKWCKWGTCTSGSSRRACSSTNLGKSGCRTGFRRRSKLPSEEFELPLQLAARTKRKA